MESQFKFKVGEFEGPLPLLLELVEKRQLPISQVSLATVADNFLDYVRGLGEPSLASLADFLVIASTLMLIKSFSLLPTLALNESEKEDIGDLEKRLKLYQIIHDLAVNLNNTFARAPIFFPELRKEEKIIFSPTAEITRANLLVEIKHLLETLPIPTPPLLHVTVKKIMSLEEMIRDLATRVQIALKMSFKDFVKDKKDKVSIIVGFLALLELCKQGTVEVEQSEHFKDIHIETRSTEIPRY